jgi:hypothetical protein
MCCCTRHICPKLEQNGGPMPANQDVKPRKDFTVITQLGLTAYQLTQQYSTQLAGRLSATLVSTLQSDLTSLDVVIPAVLGARAGSKASTKAQNDALEAGYAYVTAVRHAVARMQPSESQKSAWGVGTKTKKTIVKDVVNALQGIVTRATAQPTEATGFGITTADVTTYKAQLTAIKAADQTQEATRANAPLTTKQRNVVLNRILSAVSAISGAGVLAFATSPTERASFEALVKKVK